MLHKLFTKAVLGVSCSIVLFAPSSAIACDDKACEAAYLSSTQQYIHNQRVHAEMYRAERLAHAKNRERRAMALYLHIHQTRFGTQHSKSAPKKS